jgi:dCTP deaminase
MILSDHSIRAAIKTDEIGCDPLPTEAQYQPASLDVRLGEELYHVGSDTRIKPVRHEFAPGERYLCHTKESISLPDHTAAQLAGRSSVGRMGIIVHKTAGWIDPGFSGEITLEVMNLGNEPVVFDPGKRVAQLVFFRLDMESSGYDGHYQGQEGATEAY